MKKEVIFFIIDETTEEYHTTDWVTFEGSPYKEVGITPRYYQQKFVHYSLTNQYVYICLVVNPDYSDLASEELKNNRYMGEL